MGGRPHAQGGVSASGSWPPGSVSPEGGGEPQSQLLAGCGRNLGLSQFSKGCGRAPSSGSLSPSPPAAAQGPSPRGAC